MEVVQKRQFISTDDYYWLLLFPCIVFYLVAILYFCLS